jgi:hypothetical protein
MKLSSLLAQRRTLLLQARLANLAFAHERLSEFAARIARARLVGEVRLQQAAPDAERFWASLTALSGHQSVIEEHFTDADLMDLADVIAFATGENDLDLTFQVEELSERFLLPLRGQLEQAGVVIDHEGPPVEHSSLEGSADCSRTDESG